MVQSLQYICLSLRNKDICCEAGMLLWTIEALSSISMEEETFGLILSLAQVLGRHRAPPDHVHAYLGLLKQYHTARDAKRLSKLLKVLSSMTKQVEPSKVFDFDGSPEAGILIPPFRLSQNGYTISFWINCDAVSPELTGREQRLLSILNDLGDGIVLSMTPQRRAAQTILCVALHSKNNVTNQAFETLTFAWQKWNHVSLVHTPSRLFQRRSELKIWINGQSMGAKTLGYPDTSRPFSKACWGTDASLATEMAPPCPSLRGQLTLLGIFTEPLPDEKLGLLYTTLPDEAKPLVISLDPTHVASIYHPNIPPGDVVYDLSGHRHGVRFGSLRIIRSIPIRDSIHYLGGIELLFPLFMKIQSLTSSSPQITASQDVNPSSNNTEEKQISQSHSSQAQTQSQASNQSDSSRPHHQEQKHDDTSMVAEIIETMANIVYNSNLIKDSILQHPQTLSVLGLILERLPVEFVDIHLLEALGSFIGAMTSSADESLANLGLAELLWNPRIWTRPSFEIQQQHHKFLLAHIQSKAAHFRSKFGISFLLDLLRSYPCQTIPLTVPLSSLSLMTPGALLSPQKRRNERKGSFSSSSSTSSSQGGVNSMSTSVSTSAIDFSRSKDGEEEQNFEREGIAQHLPLEGLHAPIKAVSAPAAMDGNMFSSILLTEEASSAAGEQYSAPQTKALLAHLPPPDAVSQLSTFSIAQIRELRLVILRMMETETEYLLRPDEMSALLAVMAAADENAACEVEDSAKFLLACFEKEPKHNFSVLSTLGGFYVFLPMLDSREELVRLLCTQILRAILGVIGDDHRERTNVASQMAVVLSLSLSSFPLTLSTYYALMALMLGNSVEVNWRCDWRVKGGNDDLVARIIGFPDLDGSQTIQHPEFLPLIFELLGRADRRGSAPPETQGWDFVIRVLQDFRLLFAHRPPEHQHGALLSQGKRPKNSNHLPQFRNWAIFQTQPDWFDHLLLLYAQATETRKLRQRAKSASQSEENESNKREGSEEESKRNSLKISEPTDASAEDVNMAFDMIWTMMNQLLAFPMLELKDGWKVVQAAEIAVYRFSPRYNNHLTSGILFKPLKFLRHMYGTLLKNLAVELDRLFSAKSAPQRYAFFWENVTHLTLLVEEYLFYQPAKATLVVRESTSGADYEIVNKHNIQQLRMHMHRSKELLEILPSKVIPNSTPSASNAASATPLGQAQISQEVSSSAPQSPSPTSTPPPSNTSQATTSTSSNDNATGSVPDLQKQDPISISVTNHQSLASKPNATPSMSLGRWKDLEVASNLFDLLEYTIPHTTFSKQLSSELQSVISPNGKPPAGPTPGDMTIIETWCKLDIAREWGKEKHKILVTVLRTLVTTLFDAEMILRPKTKQRGAVLATKESIEAKEEESKEDEKLLARREAFFSQSIIRLHRFMAQLSKGHGKGLPASAQPLAAGLAFAINSVSTLSNVAATVNYSDPPFVDVVLFCTSKILKLLTQASEYPSAATARIVELVKCVLGRWTDLSYFDGAMPANCPEPNPFLERKHVFYKDSPADAVLAFASDMLRNGGNSRHQLWRGRIAKAVLQVEQGAVHSLKPMLARREYIATMLDTALEKVRLERTNDTLIHKQMRTHSQKYVNAFYTSSTLFRQKNARDTTAALRNLYRIFQQMHLASTIWQSSLLRQPLSISGKPLFKIDKSEQRPRLRRKLRQNFLGSQHRTATHAYHKEQWLKQQKRKEQDEKDEIAAAAAAAAASREKDSIENTENASTSSQSDPSSNDEIAIRRAQDPSSSLISPPLSPSSSFVKNAKVLNLPLSRSSTPIITEQASSHIDRDSERTKEKLKIEIRGSETSKKSESNSRSTPSPTQSLPNSPSKFNTSLNPSAVISADEEFEEMLNEVDTDEFKNLDGTTSPSSSKNASYSSLPGMSSASAPSIGPMQSGQPISHVLGEKVIYSSPCELILPEVKILGRIFLTSQSIHFQYDQGNSRVIEDINLVPKLGDESVSPRSSQLSASMIGVKDIGYFNWTRTLFRQKFFDRVWRIKDLTAVYCRRYMLSWTAVELAFENSGKNFFVNLPKEENRKLWNHIEELKPPKLRSSHLFCTAPQYFKKMSDTTERWKRREISNFDYLVYLNQAASRTVNDLTQYPVFPWVLSNYTAERLDLSDSRNYRDLSKPVGALETSRLEKFVERFESFVDDSIPRFHYGSHYSSAGAVLFYLLRLEPFTTQFICLQGGKFDYPDRLFSSVAESWDNCLRSTTDVKELIPEFFYLPDFLENRNELDLGTKTLAANPIDHVILPPWANGSAHEFIRIHREALESDYVSANLHHWIDLIFGFKQRGKEAVAACNTFFHVTYEGEIDLDALDSEQRQAMLSQIENFGQTPAQLLDYPHPSRDPSPREKRIASMPLNIDIAPNSFNSARLPLFQLMALRSKQFSSRLPFSTPYSLHVLNKTHLLTVNVYGEYLVHKCEYKPQISQNQSFSSHQNLQSIDPHSPEVFPVLDIDTQFSSNASPHSFPRDPSQPISRAKLAEAFIQRCIPGNKRFHAHCLGPLYAKRFAYSRFTFDVFPDDPNYAFSAGHWDGALHIVLLEDFVAPSFPVLNIRQCLHAHRLPVTCFSISEAFLITGSDDCTAKLWSVNYERKQLKILPAPRYVIRAHCTPITAVAISKPLDLIVTASEDGTIAIHQLDLKRNRTRAVLKLPGPVSRLNIVPSGYILAYCYGNRKLVALSMSGEIIAEMSLAGGDDTIDAISMNPVDTDSKSQGDQNNAISGPILASHTSGIGSYASVNMQSSSGLSMTHSQSSEISYEDDGMAQIVIAKNAPILMCATGYSVDFRSIPSLNLLYIFHAENCDSIITSMKLSDDERVLFLGFNDGALTVVTLPDWGSDLEI